MDLCVIILTSDITKETKPPKVMPKVCFKIQEKTMIEICLENVVRLNPIKIILMVSKHDIVYINKVIKYAPYSKLISYCIYDNVKYIEDQKISLTKHCYAGKNILVVPGNSPLLTSKSMYKMVSENRNLKVNNFLFYLKKENIDKIDNIIEYSTRDEGFLNDYETLRIETRSQYEDILSYFRKKKL